MAYADESPRVPGPINEHAPALAREWRRLTRAATTVALFTAPAFFLILFSADGMALAPALIVTVIAVVMFRGLVEVVTRRLIPSPSLYGAEPGLRQEDIIARRRYWYWRGKFRRLPIYIVVALALLALCQLLLALGGVSAPFFNPFSGLKTIFPPLSSPSWGSSLFSCRCSSSSTSRSSSDRFCSLPYARSAAMNRATPAGA